MSAIDLARPHVGSHLRQYRVDERSPSAAFTTGSRLWAPVVFSVAVCASIAVTTLVHVTGRNALFGDEPSHVLQAHRVFDSLTPGFGQLGNYWPPLLHWAELPFAWNPWLVRTNLAGQIPAMVMFVAAVMGAFALGVELTGRRRVGALAALIILANPNLLYLQSSSMMESGIVMSLIWVAVWLLRFRRTGRLRDVVAAAVWSGVAVFATWGALLLPVYGGLIVGWACRRNAFSWAKTRTYTAAYCLPTGYAVVLWLGWNWYLQHDPLYMISYRNSPATQAVGHTQLARLHPDAWHGVVSLGAAALDNAGPVVVLAALAVLVLGIFRGQIFHPLGVTLLGGVLLVGEWADGRGGVSGSPTFAWLEHFTGRDAAGLNVRYALWIMPFLVGAVAIAAGHQWWRQAVVTVLVVASCVWFLPSLRGVVTLHSSDMVTAADETQSITAAHRVRSTYHGGEILTSTGTGGDRTIWLSGLPARDFVTQFNGKRFDEALRNPASVKYVLVNASLALQLPDARLVDAGFHQLWTVTIAGIPQTLWVRG